MAPTTPMLDEVDDFLIEIRGHGTALEVAIGEHAAPFRTPYLAEEVARALGDDSPTRRATDPMASLGATLFTAVFNGSAGRLLWERLAEGEGRKRRLRLRIGMHGDELHHLPWELLFDSSRSDFLSLSGRVALVRTAMTGGTWREPLSALPSIRILAAEANAGGTEHPRADLVELAQLAADPLHQRRIEVVTLPNVTRDTLVETLARGRFDLFHFAGDSVATPGDKRGGASKAINLIGPGSSGGSDPLGADTLRDMLVAAGVRYAILVAQETDWIARRLVRDGVRGAIGFRDTVSDEACIAFSRALYRQLASGTPLDLAMTAARQAMDRERPGTGEWCRAICHLQAPDGTLLAPSDPVATVVGVRDASGQRSATNLRRPVLEGGLESLTLSMMREIAICERLNTVHSQNLAEVERRIANGASGDPWHLALRAELQARMDTVTARALAVGQPSVAP